MTAAKHHLLDIYGVQLHRVTKQRDWTKLRKTLTFLDKKPGAVGISHFEVVTPKGAIPQPQLVFWLDLRQSATPLDLVDTASHEATHAASQILEWIGHDTRGTDEPHAYLVGWLTRWLLDDLLDR